MPHTLKNPSLRVVLALQVIAFTILIMFHVLTEPYVVKAFHARQMNNQAEAFHYLVITISGALIAIGVVAVCFAVAQRRESRTPGYPVLYTNIGVVIIAMLIGIAFF